MPHCWSWMAAASLVLAGSGSSADDKPSSRFAEAALPEAGQLPAHPRSRAVDALVAPGAAGTGRISGTVRDAATGLPLAGVGVEIVGSDGYDVTWGATNSFGVYTSEDGLASGTYYAVSAAWANVSSYAYIDKVYKDIPCPGGVCWATTGTPIPVTDGATTSGVDFSLERGGTMAGTVTDAAGAPLANVRVLIYTATGRGLFAMFTDSSGAYTSGAGLASGLYYAKTYRTQGYLDELYDDLACPGGWCTVTAGTPISITAGATTSGIDFALSKGGRISGAVADATTTAPLSDVSVSVYNSAGNLVTTESTDGSGLYAITGLGSGTYYARTAHSPGYLDQLYQGLPCPEGACTVTSGTPIQVEAGSLTQRVDFALVRGGAISGRVRDAATSQLLADVSVEVYGPDGHLVTSVSTDSSGAYTLGPGLATGSYFARTRNSQGYIDELYDDIPCSGGVCTVTSGTPIYVTAGATTTGVEFGLATGGRINGAVKDAATGLPLASVELDVFDAAGALVARTSTDVSGAYTATGLATGSYYVRTWVGGYMNALYRDVPCPYGCAVTKGDPVSVTAGATTSGIDFALTHGGHISGTVTDAETGLPVANIYVEAYNSDGLSVSYTVTDSSGSYTIDRLASETYYARAFPYPLTNLANTPEYVPALYKDVPCPGVACTVTSGTPISVTFGATTAGIDFHLAPAGHVSGVVRGEATRQPLGNTYVLIFDSAGTLVTRSHTNGSGFYVAEDLPPGIWFARTEVHYAPGYVDELYDGIPCPGGACTVTSGTPIMVTAGAGTTVDFGLEQATSLYTVAPCRVVDTRNPAGAWGGPALAANTTREVPVVVRCGVPPTATAVAINLTVVGATDVGHLQPYAAGRSAPGSSVINFSAGQVRANNAIIALGSDGQIAVQCNMPPGSTGQTDVVIDVSGYFE
jgi:Carboxypeptidase regulatory-like domain